MTRRIIFILTALLGLAGLVFALASPASAQVGFPFFFDFSALVDFLESLADTFPFLAGFLNTIIQMVLGLCGDLCAS